MTKRDELVLEAQRCKLRKAAEDIFLAIREGQRHNFKVQLEALYVCIDEWAEMYPSSAEPKQHDRAKHTKAS